MTRVDDVFIQQLADREEDQSKMFYWQSTRVTSVLYIALIMWVLPKLTEGKESPVYLVRISREGKDISHMTKVMTSLHHRSAGG